MYWERAKNMLGIFSSMVKVITSPPPSGFSVGTIAISNVCNDFEQKIESYLYTMADDAKHMT